jgi:phage major head subunit gpT-like protein
VYEYLRLYCVSQKRNVGLGVEEMAHTDKTKLIEHGQHA